MPNYILENPNKILIIKTENFLNAYNIDVSENVETDYKGIRYLSWSYAWYFLKTNFTELVVDFVKTEDGKYHHYDDGGSYLLPYLTDGEYKSIPLYYPILDSKNKPVANPDNMQVNKALMRGATKVIAMVTGLGLKLYTGEDLDNSKKEGLITKIKEFADQLKSLTGEDIDMSQATVAASETRLIEFGKEVASKLKAAKSKPLEI